MVVLMSTHTVRHAGLGAGTVRGSSLLHEVLHEERVGVARLLEGRLLVQRPLRAMVTQRHFHYLRTQ